MDSFKGKPRLPPPKNIYIKMGKYVQVVKSIPLNFNIRGEITPIHFSKWKCTVAPTELAASSGAASLSTFASWIVFEGEAKRNPALFRRRSILRNSNGGAGLPRSPVIFLRQSWGWLKLKRLRQTAGLAKLVAFTTVLFWYMAVGQNLKIPSWGRCRCTTHFSRDFSGDWDVHWGYGLWSLTHGHLEKWMAMEMAYTTHLNQWNPSGHGSKLSHHKTRRFLSGQIVRPINLQKV